MIKEPIKKKSLLDFNIIRRLTILSNLWTWVGNLLRRMQMTRAVLYGVLTFSWRFISGPVTIFLIGTYFTPELQGYYYTFSSLLALQIFVELGIGTVIIQFASHEWSQLKLDNQGRIVGDPQALSRLVSLGRFIFRWYLVAALILIIGLGIGGYYFFSKSPQSQLNWVTPWLVLCVLTGTNLWLVSVWSLLEGCNQVSRVYAFRMVKGVLISLSVWTAISMGAGLWTAPVATAASLVLALAYLSRRYWRFFSSFWSGISGPRFNWRSEILPMQWRIAVSYLSGYFTAWVFTPLLFHFHGAVVAGQFGMTWRLIISVAGLAMMWSKPRAPQFGMLIARKDYAELDRRFFRIQIVATFVLICGALAVWLLTYILTAIDHQFATRLLPPLPAGLLALGVIASNFCAPMSVYLRAHKREPYMGVTVTLGIVTAFFAWLLGSRFGATGVAMTYAGVSIFIALPTGLWIWSRCRAKWHADIVV